MDLRNSLARIAGLLLTQTLFLAGTQASAQDQRDSCPESSIAFETSTLEQITGDPDAVLKEGRGFWEAEKPLILVQGWADEVGSANAYERFRAAVEELASLSAADRADHTTTRMTDQIIAREGEWQKAAIPYLCSVFPADVDLSRPAYFVAFVPPRAFATSEGIVIDVTKDYWQEDPANILNMMIHEFFHVGYGKFRRGRTETPLDNARLYSMAEMIQNEGMAVWVAYEAREAFPAPGEADNRLLEDPDAVASLRAALNDLFERSPSLSDDQLRRQGWRIGVTNRAYYVVGAHMARIIHAEPGKDALAQTIAEGPLSFIRLYNSLVTEEERVLIPGL